MHFDQWESEDEVEVKLLLKGGGCENKNIQYSLPMEIPHLGKAGRDLDGVRKCLLHAVWQAQGQGCSAGALGVCIGGDRAQGYLNAKEQLFRTLDDVNPHHDLAKLEDYILQTSNTLGIGTMGFGGGVTLIACRRASLFRWLMIAGRSGGWAWCWTPKPARSNVGSTATRSSLRLKCRVVAASSSQAKKKSCARR
jgi:fumarate hydratase class I